MVIRSEIFIVLFEYFFFYLLVKPFQCRWKSFPYQYQLLIVSRIHGRTWCNFDLIQSLLPNEPF